MKTDAYLSFMLDYSAGTLPPEQALAAQLHVLLSPEGRANASVWQAVGDVLDDHSATDHFLPEALEISRADYSKVPWKRGLSGVQMAKRGKDRGQFMRLDPGQSAPEHSHSAPEATVVLQGQFEDGHGVYKRGDLVVAAPGHRHRPAAFGDESCICFVGRAPLPFWRLS